MQPQKLKYDLNRRLAIFYHPLFLEVVDLWVLLLGQQPKQVRISFIAFIELNLRMQKALLYNFQLKDACMPSPVIRQSCQPSTTGSRKSMTART